MCEWNEQYKHGHANPVIRSVGKHPIAESVHANGDHEGNGCPVKSEVDSAGAAESVLTSLFMCET